MEIRDEKGFLIIYEEGCWKGINVDRDVDDEAKIVDELLIVELYSDLDITMRG